MKHFLLALSALFIFTACSDSTSSETDFQGQRIGNWFTTSQTSAKWVGSANYAKLAKGAGDTTFYAQPNGNELVLYNTSTENDSQFGITYTDSSYSFAVFDTTAANTAVNFINPFDKGANVGSYGVSDDFASATIGINSFSCDSTYNFDPTDDFEFHILNDSGGVYETIIVDTDGVVEAMNAIGC